MAEVKNTASHHIQSAQMSAIKTKSLYDGSNRLQYFVVAPKNAANGAQCQVTKYTYDGATARVDMTIEYMGLWNSTWNTTEDVLP